MSPSEQLTQDQIDLIFKGIRPEGMDINTFRELRKEKESHVRERLKGVMAFKSNDVKVVNGKRFKTNTRTYKKKVV